MSNIYKAGYIAKQQGLSLSENPFTERFSIQQYYQWAAGFNDCEMGYDLK